MITNFLILIACSDCIAGSMSWKPLVQTAFALICVASHISHIADASSAPICTRLHVPSEFLEGARAAFNPAAVYDPQQGWIVFVRYDQCYHCPEYEHKTVVLFSQLEHTRLSDLNSDSLMEKIDPVQSAIALPRQRGLGTKFFLEDHR